MYYLQAYVLAEPYYAALWKLSELPPVSAVLLPEPRDVFALLSWDCSSLCEEPTGSTHTQTHTHTQIYIRRLLECIQIRRNNLTDK